MRTTFLADIGGSKSRFALANSAGAPARMSVIENDTVADLDAAVARYLEETGARPRAATIAVAGPIDGERSRSPIGRPGASGAANSPSALDF